jgi:hypothetical protein
VSVEARVLAATGSSNGSGPDAAGALADSRVDLVALIRDGIPELEFVPGTGCAMARGKRHHIAGPAKSGKSLSIGAVAAVDVVAAGGIVVVLDRENGAEEYARRLAAVLDARGASDELRQAVSDRYRYHAWPRVSLEWGTDPSYPQALVGVDLVIFDSSRKFLTAVGLKENESDDYSHFTDSLIDPLTRDRITTVILDNAGHSDKDRARGTSSKQDLCDVAFTLKTVQEFSLNRPGRVEMTCTHSRIGELIGTWALDLGAGGYGSWRHLDGSDARRAFHETCIAVLTENRPLGRDKLLKGVRDSGIKITEDTAREWLAELASADHSPLAHGHNGYDLTPRTTAPSTPVQGRSNGPESPPDDGHPYKGAVRGYDRDPGQASTSTPTCCCADGGDHPTADGRCSRCYGRLAA